MDLNKAIEWQQTSAELSAEARHTYDLYLTARKLGLSINSELMSEQAEEQQRQAAAAGRCARYEMGIPR